MIGIGHQRPRLQHRPRLPPARGRRAHRHAPRVRHRAQGRAARGARPPAARQHRAGGPGAGGHRPGHGGLHPLRQGARRRGQAAHRCARRWRSSTRPSTRRWPSRRATSTPTAAGRWPGSSSRASPRASTAWPRRSPRPRTPASPAWSRPASSTSRRGKVRLLKPAELPADWDPTTDLRLTAWEMVHHLIRVLEAGGEGAAAELVAKLGSQGRGRPRAGLPPLHPVRAQEARRTRRCPTTAWCRAGRRLLALPERPAKPPPRGRAACLARGSR